MPAHPVTYFFNRETSIKFVGYRILPTYICNTYPPLVPVSLVIEPHGTYLYFEDLGISAATRRDKSVEPNPMQYIGMVERYGWSEVADNSSYTYKNKV